MRHNINNIILPIFLHVVLKQIQPTPRLIEPRYLACILGRNYSSRRTKTLAFVRVRPQDVHRTPLESSRVSRSRFPGRYAINQTAAYLRFSVQDVEILDGERNRQSGRLRNAETGRSRSPLMHRQICGSILHSTWPSTTRSPASRVSLSSHVSVYSSLRFPASAMLFIRVQKIKTSFCDGDSDDDAAAAAVAAAVVVRGCIVKRCCRAISSGLCSLSFFHAMLASSRARILEQRRLSGFLRLFLIESDEKRAAQQRRGNQRVGFASPSQSISLSLSLPTIPFSFISSVPTFVMLVACKSRAKKSACSQVTARRTWQEIDPWTAWCLRRSTKLESTRIRAGYFRVGARTASRSARRSSETRTAACSWGFQTRQVDTPLFGTTSHRPSIHG